MLCECGGGGIATVCLWSSEGNLRKSLMTFHICVCSGDGNTLPVEPSKSPRVLYFLLLTAIWHTGMLEYQTE